MEINKEQLDTSFELFQDDQYEYQLESLYTSIPGGSCNGCAKCCTESVHTFYVEFIQIYTYLKANNLLKDILKRVENHYFEELIEAQDCPFLDEEKKCMIYPVRPLVCRLFGYASKQEHEQNYNLVHDQNLAADQYFFDTYNVHIGDSVLNHKIEYCEDFKPGRVIKLKERHKMIDDMFQMDSAFLMADLIPEDAINMSLTNWFIYTKYTEEDASELRVQKLIEHKKL